MPPNHSLMRTRRASGWGAAPRPPALCKNYGELPASAGQHPTFIVGLRCSRPLGGCANAQGIGSLHSPDALPRLATAIP
jgi:hypothetical protein